MYRKFRNVPIFEDFFTHLSIFLRVGKYATCREMGCKAVKENVSIFEPIMCNMMEGKNSKKRKKNAVKRIEIKQVVSSVEIQKGAITIQRCSSENQKGAFAIDFIQR